MDKNTEFQTVSTELFSFDPIVVVRDVCKRWLLVLVLAVAGGVGTYIVTDMNYTPTYRSSATLVVTTRSSSATAYNNLTNTSALASVNQTYYDAAKVDGTPRLRVFTRITLPMISPTLFYLIITGFIGAFKAYSDAVALFGPDLNDAEMNTLVGYVYDMLYGKSGGYPSYASAAAIILFAIVLTITFINLMVSRKHVHYG